MLDTKVVDKYVEKYPELYQLFQGGVVTPKLTRAVIDVDRWLMEKIYADLLLAGAIKGYSSGSFRATDDCLEYLERRNRIKCTSINL